MTEQQPPESDINAEFRLLGKNLVDALRTAWESPERKRLQQELESGLKELGTSMKREIEKFSESPTGQRLKSEAQEVSERVRSGEVQNKAREELLAALRTLNNEIQKVSEKMSQAATTSGDVASTSPSGGFEGVHPDDVDSPPPPES